MERVWWECRLGAEKELEYTRGKREGEERAGLWPGWAWGPEAELNSKAYGGWFKWLRRVQ